MVRPHLVIAFFSATLVLLIAFQLIYNFGFPRLDFLHWRYQESFTVEKLSQIPIISPGSDSLSPHHGARFLLGVGKADITGPVVEINMMGYADPNQVGSGLRQRLYSRAFIIGDMNKPTDCLVYLVLDTQSGDTAIRHGVLEGLRKLGKGYAVYGQRNLAVTGTHSHSGPGAWLNYLLPQITSKGFHQQSYQAIVDGALLSIKRAHERRETGHLSFGSTEVEDANINRSPYAYLANPEAERAKYTSDVDKTMTMLKFKSAASGKNIGVLTWFPVHGTSMLGNNTLISGDNKGVAAYLLEKDMQKSDDASSDFVAGFSQSNVGDASPNVLGAYCEDGSGKRCNFEDSTCSGRNEPCHGRGPFFREKDQGTSSCFEIGHRQYVAAKELYNSLDNNGEIIQQPIVKSLHTFHDFSNFSFEHPNGSIVTTCPAALGYSFAAGTTDGPGAFDFKQNNTGSPNANPIWSVVSGFLHEPSAEQRACHGRKPILLDVGEVERPYLWTPNIVDIQLLRVGQLLIIVSPGEATTMAGRRWKEALATSFSRSSNSAPDTDPIVVLGGPANSYSHYIATEQEYNIQRYEGASTLYGPHTLNAYINLTTNYLPYLFPTYSLPPLPPGPQPPIHTNTSLSFIRGVVYDRPPFFKSFGAVLSDVKPTYRPGQTATVTFVGANPRNNLRLEKTYAAVEMRQAYGSWHQVRDDADWALVYEWKRLNSLLGTSEVTISWEIETDTKQGMYRLRYFGDAKIILGGQIVAFSGISAGFEIL